MRDLRLRDAMLRTCAGPRCDNLTWTPYCSVGCELAAKDDPLLTFLEWGCKIGLPVISALAVFLVVYHGGRALGWWGS